jgi:hypothetical protein
LGVNRDLAAIEKQNVSLEFGPEADRNHRSAARVH